MLPKYSSDTNSVSLPISGRNKDSDKTNIVDYEDNEPKNDVEDKDNIEALQIEKKQRYQCRKQSRRNKRDNSIWAFWSNINTKLWK